MSDSYLSLTVILDEPANEEGIHQLAAAIKMLTGVQEVIHDSSLDNEAVIRLSEQIKIRGDLLNFAINIGNDRGTDKG